MADRLDFLTADHGMSSAIANNDWAATPLGPAGSWPHGFVSVLNLMLDSAKPTWLAWGPDLTFLYNDAYRPMLGTKSAWALGQPLSKVWSEIWPDVGPLIERTMRGETVSVVDAPLRVSRGIVDEVAYFTFDYTPLRDPTGGINGLFCNVTETTDPVIARSVRAEAELALKLERDQALRAEKAALANAERVKLALSAGAIIGTWVWDLTTDEFTVDEAFAINFGLDPALGRAGISLAQVVQTVHPADQDGLAAAINEAITRGGRYAHQYRVRRWDGQYYWLEANGHVEHDASGAPLRFPGVLIDMQERRELISERDRALTELQELNETLEHRIAERTAELKRSEERLRHAQKMEAVGQLTGGLAHDFNNLLAGISGSLEMMERRIAQGRISEVDRYVTAAQGASKRAAALTHRLLAFSRRQTLAPVSAAIGNLTEGVRELIERTIGPQIDLSVEVPAGTWGILVDVGQLENALLNLCINARDAMPDGGRILIAAQNVNLDEPSGRLAQLAAGDYVRVDVIDNGAGMSPDVMARAFDPFYTTKPTGQGTGLGLSMVYGFAGQSGGTIALDSEPGVGTTVTLYLPRHDANAECGQEVEPKGADLQLAERKRKVLVVDDEVLIRMMTVEMLQDLGYEVLEAGDGPSAMRAVEADPQIEMLVSDVGLPGGMNGRQLADAVRAMRSGIKVLFITGYAENAVLKSGDLSDDMQVLTKPFQMDTIAEKVRQMLA